MEYYRFFLTDAECYRTSNSHPTGVGIRHALCWETPVGTFRTLYVATCECITISKEEMRSLAPTITPYNREGMLQRLVRNADTCKRLHLPFAQAEVNEAITLLKAEENPAPIVRERTRTRG